MKSVDEFMSDLSEKQIAIFLHDIPLDRLKRLIEFRSDVYKCHIITVEEMNMKLTDNVRSIRDAYEGDE